MAIFHCQSKPISRSAGRSATASAAYRAADKIVDERTGEIHDYRHKSGVEFTQLVIQDGGPDWNRQQLWNAAEAAEKRKDSRVCREWELALPAELSSKQRQALALEFAQSLVTRYQVAVDVAIHAPGKGGDSRNHHAHVLTTTRAVTAKGIGVKTDLELCDSTLRKQKKATSREQVTAIREQWAGLVNRYLHEKGLEVRIDHRSLEAQGITREATKHVGPTATAMERKGIKTERGDLNRSALAVRDLQQEVEWSESLNFGVSLAKGRAHARKIAIEKELHQKKEERILREKERQNREEIKIAEQRAKKIEQLKLKKQNKKDRSYGPEL